MKLYSTDIADQSFRGNGLSYWTSTGTACEVNGEQMVRLVNGAIMPIGRQWHHSRAEALRMAARRIQTLGELLLRQASDLRADADRQEVP